jgi:hypothetical protein
MALIQENTSTLVYDVQLLQLKRQEFIQKTIVDKVLDGKKEHFDFFIQSKKEQLVINETVFSCPGYYPSIEVLIKYKGKVLGSHTFTYVH